jgi:hypothetical protein
MHYQPSCLAPLWRATSPTNLNDHIVQPLVTQLPLMPQGILRLFLFLFGLVGVHLADPDDPRSSQRIPRPSEETRPLPSRSCASTGGGERL